MAGIDVQIANVTADGDRIQNSGYNSQVGDAHSDACTNTNRLRIDILTIGIITGSLGIGHDLGILDHGVHNQIAAIEQDSPDIAADQSLIIGTDQMDGNGTGDTQVACDKACLGSGGRNEFCRISLHRKGTGCNGIVIGLRNVCLVIVAGHIHSKARTQSGAGIFHGVLCFLGIHSGLEGELQIRNRSLVTLSLEDRGDVDIAGILILTVIVNVLDIDRGLARKHQRILYQEGVVGKLDHNLDLVAHIALVNTVLVHSFAGGLCIGSGDPHIGVTIRRSIQIQLDVHIVAGQRNTNGHIALGHLETVDIIHGTVFLNVALDNLRKGHRLSGFLAIHQIGNVGCGECNTGLDVDFEVNRFTLVRRMDLSAVSLGIGNFNGTQLRCIDIYRNGLLGNKFGLEEIFTVIDLASAVTIIRTLIKIAAIGILADEDHFDLIGLLGVIGIPYIFICDPVFAFFIRLELVTEAGLDNEVEHFKCVDALGEVVVFLHQVSAVFVLAHRGIHDDGAIGQFVNLDHTMAVCPEVLILRTVFAISAGRVVCLNRRTVGQGFHIHLTVGKNGKGTVRTHFTIRLNESFVIVACVSNGHGAHKLYAVGRIGLSAVGAGGCLIHQRAYIVTVRIFAVAGELVQEAAQGAGLLLLLFFQLGLFFLALGLVLLAVEIAGNLILDLTNLAAVTGDFLIAGQSLDQFHQSHGLAILFGIGGCLIHHTGLGSGTYGKVILGIGIGSTPQSGEDILRQNRDGKEAAGLTHFQLGGRIGCLVIGAGSHGIVIGSYIAAGGNGFHAHSTGGIGHDISVGACEGTAADIHIGLVVHNRHCHSKGQPSGHGSGIHLDLGLGIQVDITGICRNGRIVGNRNAGLAQNDTQGKGQAQIPQCGICSSAVYLVTGADSDGAGNNAAQNIDDSAGHLNGDKVDAGCLLEHFQTLEAKVLFNVLIDRFLLHQGAQTGDQIRQIRKQTMALDALCQDVNYPGRN